MLYEMLAGVPPHEGVFTPDGESFIFHKLLNEPQPVRIVVTENVTGTAPVRAR